MNGHKNIVIAIVLSLIVLIGWQYFVGYPQTENHRHQELLDQQKQTQPGSTRHTAAGGVPLPTAPTGRLPALSREASIAASPRNAIDTPRLRGSINLNGGRIDDLSLEQYHETVDPNSAPIVLLSPAPAPDAYYAAFGWLPASGTTAKMPGPDTVWKQQGTGTLGVGHPVTLIYDNGAGLPSAAPSRWTTSIFSPSKIRYKTMAELQSRCFPMR